MTRAVNRVVRSTHAVVVAVVVVGAVTIAAMFIRAELPVIAVVEAQ